MGETGRRLGDRFREHLRHVVKVFSKSVAYVDVNVDYHLGLVKHCITSVLDCFVYTPHVYILSKTCRHACHTDNFTKLSRLLKYILYKLK